LGHLTTWAIDKSTKRKLRAEGSETRNTDNLDNVQAKMPFEAIGFWQIDRKMAAIAAYRETLHIAHMTAMTFNS
jgi:hypothetical protein